MFFIFDVSKNFQKLLCKILDKITSNPCVKYKDLTLQNEKKNLEFILKIKAFLRLIDQILVILCVNVY